MDKNVFLLETVFITGVIIFCMIRLAIISKEYDRYLKENYFEKWKELTTVFGIGPGMVNSYRAWKFLFSKEDFGDKQFSIIKTKARNASLHALTCFIALPIFLLMITILTKRN